jgi:hypothetical protein
MHIAFYCIVSMNKNKQITYILNSMKLNFRSFRFLYDLLSWLSSLTSTAFSAKYKLPLLIIIIFVVILLILTYLFLKKIFNYYLESRVRLFYSSLAKKDYNKSWSYLSDRFKIEKWKNEMKEFEKGYRFTKSIKLLSILPIRDRNKFIVVYKDEIELLMIKDIEDISQAKISQIDDVALKIKSIENSFANQGLDVDKFRKIDLHNLFKANASDIIRWELKADFVSNGEKNAQNIKFYQAKIITLTKISFIPIYRIDSIISLDNYTE